MNRREPFKSIARIAAATGVKGSVIEQPVVKPALVVFEAPHYLGPLMSQRLCEMFEAAMKDGPFEGIKAIVLEQGMKMSMLDSNGNVLNRTVA